MTPAVRVLSPGPLTSVQDLGRPGYQRFGIPVGGALDPLSLRAANLLVGNPPDAGGVEMAIFGATLVVEAARARLAFVGANADIRVSRADAARSRFEFRPGRSVMLQRGDTLQVGRLRGSATLYMAVEGGFEIAPVMGSVSTYVRGNLGGWQGRPLQAGDRLPLSKAWVEEKAELRLDGVDLAPPQRVRVVDGPQSDFFSAEERAAFFGRDYVVGADWNRMGMRLEGAPLKPSRGYNVTSDGIVRGSIQIPGDGKPIVLLSEHQTTGGYPKIGAVISADLAALGRLRPGARVAFARVSLDEAEAARREWAMLVDNLPLRLSATPAQFSDMPTRLFDANLISGVIDAADWAG